MDAKIVNDFLEDYRTGRLDKATVGLALILAGCSGGEAAALINLEDANKKLSTTPPEKDFPFVEDYRDEQ